MTSTTTLACACGKVQFQVTDPPIIATECHCSSCREAGARMEALPGARQIRIANGGTPCVLYRKDRVQVTKGGGRMREFRIKADSPTRRIVAECCNTPLFLEFQNGHWLSVYSALWPDGSAPPAQLRTMTSDLPDGIILDDTIPNARTQSFSFFAKLLGAWVAMGFRSPKIDVEGKINA